MRTAWLVGAVALAFYGLSLVMGHDGRLHTSWHSGPTAASAQQNNAAGAAPAAAAQARSNPQS